MEPLPLLLIADAVPARAAFVRTHLAPLGWRVAIADDGGMAPTEVPALVLLDPGLASAGIAHGIRRAGEGPPILAFAGEGDSVADSVAGIDGIIAWPCTPEALAAAIRPWQPVDMTLDRLAAMFGTARLAGLLADFDAQLAHALDRLDEADSGLAHRIGGLAGTLGFARVSAAWLAVSEGEVAAVPAARASALAARAAIERRLGAPDVPTASAP
ncbi:response regulator transcription factor [Sphingomonas solaris]|uniref:Response regulator transcription factor n=1 Tax=Alterirhizorhabdus solaris TaxID=2529389 RepID=A0A558R330_9SPHN|nr:response regulator transcription factor [Sphingomonas solaris]TVV73789.1 response regulator transcription factor [Sphingomonas solaris]